MGKIQTEGWVEYELSDICKDVRYGYTASSNEEEVGPKFLRITDIVPDFIDWNEVPYCEITEKDFKKYQLEVGDIVVARTGATTGYAKRIKNPPKAVFASYLVRLKIKDEFNDKYVGYVIESDDYKEFIKKNWSGAAQPNANAKVITSYSLKIPDYETQQKIASILSAFDDLIENNSRRIEILEEMARRIYREWFVHFRYPGHEDDELVDSGTDLGEIPEGWQAIKLGDVLTKLESGKRPKGGVSQYDDGVPSVGAENVLGVGQYDYSKEKYVPEDFYKEMNKGVVEDYDVLIYKDGASLGRVSIFGDGFPHRELCINSHAYLVRTDNTCSQAYLYFWMDSPMIKSTIRNSNTNAAQPGINMGDVRGFPFLIPSDKILEKFDEIGVPIVSEIFHLAKKNQRLKETRDLLLPKLISGKIDVGELHQLGNEENVDYSAIEKENL